MIHALVLAAATLVILTAWGAFVLAALTHRGALGGLGSVAALGTLTLPLWAELVLGAFVVAVAITLLRRRELVTERLVAASSAVLLFTLAGTLASRLGAHAPIVTSALVLALVSTLALGRPPAALAASGVEAPARPTAWTPVKIAIAVWLVVTAVSSTFAMHRHWAFGSGSWDMGCMIHNLYRSSRFLDSTSTVLGDVDYLGDHFMIGIYLFAPIMWVNSSGYTLILLQSASLAAVAPVVFLLASDRGAPRVPALVLALGAGLAFGMQSAAYFDSHEITLGFGFLALAVWALETKRLGLATLFVALFALFKESLGAYVVGLGLLLVWRGIRARERRTWLFGLAWIVGGAIWFVLVNRVFMPALIARANAPEPHETFGDFGPTVFTALVGIATHPLKALGALFVPGEKIESLLVTFGGLGWLALASPQILLPALPLFAERFLSSKTTMWEMGYHYAAPLTFYSAWAAAIGWPRIERAARWALDGLALGWGARAPIAIAAYVVASTALVNSIGYRHPANFHRWREPYFSTPARRDVNARAIAELEALGRDARLAVQNRLLPHLADRPVIYRLGDWQKADWVLLNVAESAWPWDDGYPARLARELAASAEWVLVFSEGETAIFARRTVTDRAAVPPSPALRLPRT
ncbi:DUF2079 domain-containing protein [Myxococcota bacterium]|nr:DUF2079 domain-containing protein [Myxococcota bacterium]